MKTKLKCTYLVNCYCFCLLGLGLGLGLGLAHHVNLRELKFSIRVELFRSARVRIKVRGKCRNVVPKRKRSCYILIGLVKNNR